MDVGERRRERAVLGAAREMDARVVVGRGAGRALGACEGGACAGPRRLRSGSRVPAAATRTGDSGRPAPNAMNATVAAPAQSHLLTS